LCLVIRDSMHVENKTHGYDMGEINKLGLATDLQRLLEIGICSHDLLEYLWKTHFRFLLDLARRTLLMSDWGFDHEPSCLIPCMITSSKKYDNAESEYGLSFVFDFSQTFFPLGVFQRLVCLCVSYSRLYTTSQAPTLYQESCTLFWGSEEILIQDVKDNIKVTISKGNSKVSEILRIMRSMMMKIKNDMSSSSTAGEGISWILQLQDCTVNRRRYVDFEQAKKLKLAPWFETFKDAKETTGVTLNLEEFLSDMKFT